jgi:hypothetical protein
VLEPVASCEVFMATAVDMGYHVLRRLPQRVLLGTIARAAKGT